MFDNTILAANKEGRRALTLLMTFPSLRIVEMAARGDSPSLGPPQRVPTSGGPLAAPRAADGRFVPRRGLRRDTR